MSSDNYESGHRNSGLERKSDSSDTQDHESLSNDQQRHRNWKYSKTKNFLVDGKNRWEEKDRKESGDRFEDVVGPGQPRSYTLSIAVPATILDETCIKDEIRTYVVGQIARAATIYSVDEIVVYNDRCWHKGNNDSAPQSIKDLLDIMKMLLEYQECPQYLRKHFFDYHPYLSFVGLLNALNAPHHLRFNQWCEYREGVVLEGGNKDLSYVNIGLNTDISVYQKLKKGLRVTVKLPPEAREMKKPYGIVVSPNEPREKAGYYWGYTVRVANSLAEVVSGCRFSEGYDLLIGTSDKGEDINKTEFPTFSHAIIVFGGVDGLEIAIEEDKDLEATQPQHLFDYYLNTCPNQQANTIRTEEAVLISLATLNPHLIHKGKK